MANFQGLASAVEQVYLVEAGSALRETQKQLLCGGEPFEEVKDGVRCKSKYNKLPITWYEDIRYVPNGSCTKPDSIFPLLITLARTVKNPIHRCS